MEKVVLEAKKRTIIDKASRSALRKEGRVPAIFIQNIMIHLQSIFQKEL